MSTKKWNGSPRKIKLKSFAINKTSFRVKALKLQFLNIFGQKQKRRTFTFSIFLFFRFLFVLFLYTFCLKCFSVYSIFFLSLFAARWVVSFTKTISMYRSFVVGGCWVPRICCFAEKWFQWLANLCSVSANIVRTEQNKTKLLSPQYWDAWPFIFISDFIVSSVGAAGLIVIVSNFGSSIEHLVPFRSHARECSCAQHCIERQISKVCNKKKLWKLKIVQFAMSISTLPNGYFATEWDSKQNQRLLPIHPKHMLGLLNPIDFLILAVKLFAKFSYRLSSLTLRATANAAHVEIWFVWLAKLNHLWCKVIGSTPPSTSESIWLVFNNIFGTNSK